MRMTELQLVSFLDICYDKYYRALIEPGEQSAKWADKGFG